MKLDLIKRGTRMKYCRFPVAVLSIWLAMATDAQPSSFYRLSTSTNSVITGLTPGGLLSWSNSVTQGEYLVERTLDPTSGLWAPFTSGEFSNEVWSCKVHDPSPPEGMCFIPGGRFTMGDVLGDLNNASPVHRVYVKPFFMKRYEVSNQEMRDVLQWAYDRTNILVTTDGVTLANGSTNVLLALNKYNSEISFAEAVFTVRVGRNNFPCAQLSWFGAAAYCYFLNVIEGREQSYDLADWSCDFDRKGYRLPTEAEWEFAARGGFEGLRFPWSDTNVITHSRANYQSSTNFQYDVSPTLGFHPDYASLSPRSSPVGTFAPNNYGLYDMCGNVWEWVWDWAARYSAATQYDPTGPAGGVYRVFRGGSWFTVAASTTCASRYTSMSPSRTFEDFGFRPLIPDRE